MEFVLCLFAAAALVSAVAFTHHVVRVNASERLPAVFLQEYSLRGSPDYGNRDFWRRGMGE
jgi:hypothetical protein